MPYTFVPKHGYAKAYSANSRISTIHAEKICKVIRKKKLDRAKRLLNDLKTQKRSLGGKYYTKTVSEILNILNSCEKNADFLGLDKEKLFVHVSAHDGSTMRRRRRKSSFGSRLKTSNIEVMLIERGKAKVKKKEEKKTQKQTKEKPAQAHEHKEHEGHKEKAPEAEHKEPQKEGA